MQKLPLFGVLAGTFFLLAPLVSQTQEANRHLSFVDPQDQSIPRSTIEVSSQCEISTIVGNGHSGFAGDGGPAREAMIDNPQGLAVDAKGNLYIADTVNNRIRLVDSQGTISTIVGGDSHLGDDDLFPHILVSPHGVAVDKKGAVYIADTFNGNGLVKKYDEGVITIVEGIWPISDNKEDSPYEFNHPKDVSVDADDNLYVADMGSNRIWKVAADTSEIVSMTSEVELNFPEGLAIDHQGHLYVADTSNHRVRHIAPDGQSDTFASGAMGLNMSFPKDIAVDGEGYVYLPSNGYVYRISPQGQAQAIAGGGDLEGRAADGQTANKALLFINAIAVDAQGMIYLADQFSNSIRKLVCHWLPTSELGAAAQDSQLPSLGVSASSGCSLNTLVNSKAVIGFLVLCGLWLLSVKLVNRFLD